MTFCVAKIGVTRVMRAGPMPNVALDFFVLSTPPARRCAPLLHRVMRRRRALRSYIATPTSTRASCAPPSEIPARATDPTAVLKAFAPIQSASRASVETRAPGTRRAPPATFASIPRSLTSTAAHNRAKTNASPNPAKAPRAPSTGVASRTRIATATAVERSRGQASCAAMALVLLARFVMASTKRRPANLRGHPPVCA